MSARRLSDLECFTLGLVWETGPCSAYDIRRRLVDSPSSQWSGSAGAIYPLVRRLEKRGLLSSGASATGRRRRRLYSIRPAGIKALQAWIGPPLHADAVTVAHDPLRSRARFLGAATPGQRRKFVDAADGALDEVARRVARWHGLYAGKGSAIAAALTRSGELDITARRTWLTEIRRALELPGGGLGVAAGADGAGRGVNGRRSAPPARRPRKPGGRGRA